MSFTRGVCWQESGEKKICVATQRQRYDKIIRTKETVELSLCQNCSRSVDLTEEVYEPELLIILFCCVCVCLSAAFHQSEESGLRPEPEEERSGR